MRARDRLHAVLRVSMYGLWRGEVMGLRWSDIDLRAKTYLAVDTSGYPAHPEWYSDEFLRMAQQAGLARIRLHDSRYTALSLMEKAGVSISIISKWAGHCDPSFTHRTYVHANDDDLEVAARSIGKLSRQCGVESGEKWREVRQGRTSHARINKSVTCCYVVHRQGLEPRTR